MLVGRIGEQARLHRHGGSVRVGKVAADALAQDLLVLPVALAVHAVRIVDALAAMVIFAELESRDAVDGKPVESPFRRFEVEHRKGTEAEIVRLAPLRPSPPLAV